MSICLYCRSRDEGEFSEQCPSAPRMDLASYVTHYWVSETSLVGRKLLQQEEPSTATVCICGRCLQRSDDRIKSEWCTAGGRKDAHFHHFLETREGLEANARRCRAPREGGERCGVCLPCVKEGALRDVGRLDVMISQQQWTVFNTGGYTVAEGFAGRKDLALDKARWFANRTGRRHFVLGEGRQFELVMPEKLREPEVGWQAAFERLVLRGHCPWCGDVVAGLHQGGSTGLSWSCKEGCNP